MPIPLQGLCSQIQEQDPLHFSSSTTTKAPPAKVIVAAPFSSAFIEVSRSLSPFSRSLQQVSKLSAAAVSPMRLVPHPGSH